MRTRTGRQVDPFGGGGLGALGAMAGKKPQGPIPALSLNFFGAWSGATSFSRASNATQFDSQGRLVWAPHQLGSRGNMASGWTIGAEGVLTVLPGALPSGRDGFNITTSVASPVSLTGIGSQTVVVGAAHVFTVKVRYVNHPWIRIAIYSGSSSVNQVRAWFNMETGVTGTVQNSGTATGASFDTPINCGNGWWQLTIRGTVPFTAITDGALLIAMAVADASTTRPGVGSSFDVGEPLLEVAGPQAPQVFTANHLTAGAVWYGPRFDYNPATLAARGLLVEETRANSVSNSSDLSGGAWTRTDITASQVTGVGGAAAAAWRMTEGSAGTSALISISPGTVTAGSRITGSAFLKKSSGADWVRMLVCETTLVDGANGWFNLATGLPGSATARGAGSSISSSMQSLGSGWYLCSLSCIPNGTYTAPSIFIASASGDLSGVRVSNAVWDIQLPQIEVGAFATSRIPTFGTAATRSGDVGDLINSPPWNVAGTSFYCEYERYAIPPSGTNSAPFYFGDTAGANFVGMFFGTTDPTTFRIDMMASSFLEAQVFANPPSSEVANTVYKSAGRLASNDANIARNGVLSTADTSANMLSAIPTGRWTLGRSNAASTLQMHGWLRRLDIYTVALPDATLQALTT